MKKPIVGIISELETIPIEGWGNIEHYTIYRKYVDALLNYTECLPLLIPTFLIQSHDLSNYCQALISRLDGILLPGGASHIDESLYSVAEYQDRHKVSPRDKIVISMIREAAKLKLPILGICRGMQEINIALGGTLIKQIHETKGKLDHRSDKKLSLEGRYLPRHHIKIMPHSWINKNYLNNDSFIFLVNSLHSQGIDKLGKGLTIDAVSEDGIIEAISYQSNSNFIFGVQWHPEWYVKDNFIYEIIWKYFNIKCQAYAGQKKYEH